MIPELSSSSSVNHPWFRELKEVQATPTASDAVWGLDLGVAGISWTSLLSPCQGSPLPF